MIQGFLKLTGRESDVLSHKDKVLLDMCMCVCAAVEEPHMFRIYRMLLNMDLYFDAQWPAASSGLS